MVDSYNGFKVIDWFESKTLEQEYSKGVKFYTEAISDAKSYVNFSKLKEESLAIVTIEFEYVLKDYFTYIAQSQFYFDYTTYEDEEKRVIKMINKAKENYLNEFALRKQKFDFTNDFSIWLHGIFPKFHLSIIRHLHRS